MNINKRYVQISAGRGPSECAWVVSQVLKAVFAFSKQKGITCELVSRNPGTESGTLNSCVVKLTGEQVDEMMSSWEGTIQWIGKSRYRKFHKRKNWFVGVSTYSETGLITFDQKDLHFNTFRASGPGGQHRNKVETAVRIVHKPTNISVTASDSRSQVQNRKAALNKMKSALERHQMEVMQSKVDEQWREHLSLQRGNPVKVFEGREFKERKP